MCLYHVSVVLIQQIGRGSFSGKHTNLLPLALPAAAPLMVAPPLELLFDARISGLGRAQRLGVCRASCRHRWQTESC